MLRSTVLYRWLLDYLNLLTDTAASNAFFATLNQTEQSDFLLLIQDLERLRNLVKRCKATGAHTDKWVELSEVLRRFYRAFPRYPNIGASKSAVHLALGAFIAESGIDLDKNDIALDKFQIIKLDDAPPQTWFSSYNPSHLDRSLAFFLVRFFTEEDFENEILPTLRRAGPNPIFLLHALAAMRRPEDLNHNNFVIVRSGKVVTEASARAAAQLAVLASGQTFHKSQEYRQPPTIINSDQIDVASRYERLGDILDILSEYNERKDLLSKYLSLYHVIESYSFKTPLVKFFRDGNGMMFSLRDFKRLVNATDQGQGEAQHKFFEAVFGEVAQGTTSIRQIVVDRWNRTAGDVANVTATDSLMTLMKVKNKKGHQITCANFGQSPARNFSSIVYAVRNHMVHNQVTEFHLTQTTLSSSIIVLLADFLIPTLEEICFYLTIKPNLFVWFSHPEVKLHR